VHRYASSCVAPLCDCDKKRREWITTGMRDVGFKVSIRSYVSDGRKEKPLFTDEAVTAQQREQTYQQDGFTRALSVSSCNYYHLSPRYFKI
jgi:hypothetical protein